MYMSLIHKSAKEYFMWIKNNPEIDLAVNCILQDCFAWLLFSVTMIFLRDTGTLHPVPDEQGLMRIDVAGELN